jgi:succinate-acetate transporter protein
MKATAFTLRIRLFPITVFTLVVVATADDCRVDSELIIIVLFIIIIVLFIIILLGVGRLDHGRGVVGAVAPAGSGGGGGRNVIVAVVCVRVIA